VVVSSFEFRKLQEMVEEIVYLLYILKKVHYIIYNNVYKGVHYEIYHYYGTQTEGNEDRCRD